MGVFSEMSIDTNYDYELQEEDGVDQMDTKEISSITGGDVSNGSIPVEDKSSDPIVKNNTEDEKRAAHEATEKERREQWEREKKEEEEREKQALKEIALMDDDSIIHSAIDQVTLQGERITRRNMKMCVIEHIKACCKEDPAFARLLKHPRKNMINCFAYITRHAMEYIKKDLKVDGNIPFTQVGYGEDVPDDLCYQWAIDYFRDLDAEEDKETEKKFIPRPYSSNQSAGKKGKKNTKEKKKQEAPQKQAGQVVFPGQISLFDVANNKEKAG